MDAHNGLMTDRVNPHIFICYVLDSKIGEHLKSASLCCRNEYKG